MFTKGGGAWLPKIAAIGCDAVGVDWTTELSKQAREAVAGRVALQGNLDPSALFAPPETLRAETLRVLESYGEGPGHVFNLGHGITPDVHPDRVALLVETVRAVRPLARSARLSRSAGRSAAQFVAQCAAQDLADVGLGQLAAEINMLGYLVAGQFGAAIRDQGLRGEIWILLDHE